MWTFDRVTVRYKEGAAALVLDVAGPVRFVVEGEDLLRIASGETLVPVPGGHAWNAC